RRVVARSRRGDRAVETLPGLRPGRGRAAAHTCLARGPPPPRAVRGVMMEGETSNFTPSRGLAAARLAIESLREAAGCGGIPARDEAVGRLGLLVDVGECLEAEGSGAADPVAAFVEGFLARVEAGEVGDFESLAAEVERESSARWGDYLRLIDPASVS